MKIQLRKMKTRLIVKNGHKNIVLLPGDIAMLYIKERTVFVVGHDSKKYNLHKSLTEIEQELDMQYFFQSQPAHYCKY